MPQLTSRSFAVPALFAALLVASSCTWNRFKAQATESIPMAYVPAAPIDVQTRNGSIEVIGGHQAKEIQIEATITASGASQSEANSRLEEIKIRCTRDKSEKLLIRVEYPDTPRGSDGVSFVIRTPDADGAILRSSNGSLKVTSITGALDMDTSNGRVHVVDHSGAVKARSSNGRVTIKDASGPVNARTSNGRVEIELRPDAEGPLQIRTSNGRVTAVVGKAFQGRMDLDTSNGRVRVDNQADADIETHLSKKRRNGRIQFSRSHTESKIRSSNGSITVTIK